MDVYLGGEADKEPKTIPKHYEYFFSARLMAMVLLTIAVMALLAGVP
jgi:hypothetical protein